MNIIDRIVLTIYTFCLAVLSVILILFPLDQFDILSMNNVNSIFTSMKGNYAYSIIGLAFLLVSIRFLISGIKGSRGKTKVTYIVQRTDYGEINISSETVVGLVQSVSDKFIGVRNIKTRVDILEGQVFVNLKGEVSPEINIPETTLELQSKVKSHVEQCTGVNVNEIKVEISNVTAPIRNVK